MANLDQILKYSGILLWIGLGLFILLRVIFGKNWFYKVGLLTFLGPGLRNSLRRLIGEFPNEIKKETLADVGANVIWRLTRLGAFALLIAGLPIWLLVQQNQLIDDQNNLFELQNKKIDAQLDMFAYQNERIAEQTKMLETQTNLFSVQTDLLGDQNEKLDVQTGLFENQNSLVFAQNEQLKLQSEMLSTQNDLIESDRRSSLVILLSNIFNQIDTEISSQKKLEENLKYELSEQLIGRIAALSQGFIPYYYLNDNRQISYRPISFERGQLALTIIKSGLSDKTLSNIYKQTTFAHADLQLANLNGDNLNSIYLPLADLQRSNLDSINLENAFLSQSTFVEASLYKANLSNSILYYSDLSNCNLTKSNLSNADLTGVDLSNTDLSNSNMSGVLLDQALVDSKEWFAMLDIWKVVGREKIISNYNITEIISDEGNTIYMLEIKGGS